jgi:hypothetical protein
MITIILNNKKQIVYNDIKNEEHIYKVLSDMHNSLKIDKKYSVDLVLAGVEFNINDVKEIKRVSSYIYNNK